MHSTRRRIWPPFDSPSDTAAATAAASASRVVTSSGGREDAQRLECRVERRDSTVHGVSTCIDERERSEEACKYRSAHVSLAPANGLGGVTMPRGERKPGRQLIELAGRGRAGRDERSELAPLWQLALSHGTLSSAGALCPSLTSHAHPVHISSCSAPADGICMCRWQRCSSTASLDATAAAAAAAAAVAVAAAVHHGAAIVLLHLRRCSCS